MLQSLAKKTFFQIPALLLVVLIALTVSAEIDVKKNQEAYASIVRDRIPELGMRFYDNLWELEQTVEFYPIDTDTEALQTHLKDLFQKSVSTLTEIDVFLQSDLAEVIEHNVDMENLSIIHKHMEDVSKALSSFPLHDRQAWEKAHETLESLLEETHAFNRIVAHTHSKELDELQDKNTAQTKDRIVYLSLTLVMFALLGGVVFYNGYSFNRRSAIAHAAEKRNALFIEVLQSAKIGIVIRDLQKTDSPVVFINKYFTEMTGYTFAEIINKPLYFLTGMHTDQDALLKLTQSFQNRQTTSIDLLIYRKDNTPFWSEWHISPVVQKDGHVSHFVSLITDISNSRATQESLRLAKEEAERAMNVKGHFLAAMSHELRTPINGMLGILELLCDTPLQEEQGKYVQIARSSGERLLEIVNDILDYSKIEAGKLELEPSPFSLRQLIQDVLDLMESIATAKKIELRTSVDENAPDYLLSDSGRIRQILLNLVANGIKFTETGTVTIKITHLLNQSEHEQDLALMRFEVIDTGIGISTADTQRLFNDFMQVDRSYTRRFGGTGLGLAICKQLVKLLNGEIGVDSRPGQGSKFWFMLPIQVVKSSPAPLQPRATTQKRVGPSNNAKPVLPTEVNPLATMTNHSILLVEDNMVNQLVASRYIQKVGYRVDVASTGLEAIEKVKAKDYDAIFMDISMPEMDGLTATREIRSLGGKCGEVPIIALTAHVMRGDREQCIAAGMNDYLCKPLHFESLRKALTRWMPAVSDVIPDQVNTSSSDALSSSPATDRVFDPSVLNTLAQDLDRAMVLRITQVFLDDFAKRIENVRSALASKDFAILSHESHALKSSSASCGLTQFSALMREMEASSNKEDFEKLSLLANQIEKSYTEARDALTEGRKVFET